jgi:lipopolysaccharide transport system ATP-binding protein
MKPIIKVENLSKQYRLGAGGTPQMTFRETLMQAAKSPLAKFRKSEEEKEARHFWALKDIDFEIYPGEVVGIIGRNGAGKSTLLKILSRITEPTTGKIELYGRVGSLLEVGTGFHPELTGRENIFLNGAILGMRQSEIARKFDEIVDFAEVEKFIDTPVKYYSSGMYTRLAFAVAANLEPEILIVDEVLAVGDAEFQKKCLGKMKDVSEHGRTVLFVSHQMSAVAQLCSRGIMLKGGRVDFQGKSQDVIEAYLNSSNKDSNYFAEETDNPTQILSAELLDEYGNSSAEFGQDEEITLKLKIKNFSNRKGVVCAVCLYDMMDKILTVDCFDIESEVGYQTQKFVFPKELLVSNKFKFGISLFVPNVEVIEIMSDFLFFEITNTSDTTKYGHIETGLIKSNSRWMVVNE